MVLTGVEIGAIIFVIVVVLVIIVVVIVVIYNNGKKNGNDNNKILAITGQKFTVGSSTSIKATWESTGSDVNQVILYASTEAITIDKGSGLPIPPSDGTKIFISPEVVSTALTTTVTGLTKSTLYYLALVVTNPSIVDDSNTVNGKLRTTSNIPNGGINIIKQGVPNSRIGVDTSVIGLANPVFYYPTNPSTTPSIATTFIHDSGFLCLENGTSCDPATDNFLYYDSGTVDLNLAIPSDNNIDPSLYTWTYSSGNEWCLTSTLNTTPTCMVTGTQTSGSERIVLVTANGTKWDNVNV